jgi:hypothetical protein
MTRAEFVKVLCAAKDVKFFMPERDDMQVRNG